MTFTSPCKRRRRRRRAEEHELATCSRHCSFHRALYSSYRPSALDEVSPHAPQHLTNSSNACTGDAFCLRSKELTSGRRKLNRPEAKQRHLRLFRPLLLAFCAISAANGFTITWPAAFVQCEPASIGIATDGLANVLGIDITVRKGPRLDRIFIEEPISPTATIWNWTAVDVQAGTPLVLSVLAYGADNATIGAALTHALVRLPDNGPAQTECLQKKRKDEDTNRKGIGLELPLIAGILGGILLTLLVLIVFMCLRRRRERAREDAGSLQGHGRTSLLLNGAEPGSGGSTAGWGYMAAVVPGLAPRPALSPSQVQANRNNPQRLPHRWARRTHRADDGGDGELPSYGRSQWEKAKLPKYDHGNAQPEEGHAAMGCDHEAIMMMPLANHTAHQRPYGVDENAEAFDNSTAELNPEHSDQTDEQDNAGGIGTGTAIGSGISNVHRRSRSGAARPPAVRYNASRSPPQTAETFASATSQDGYDDAYDHHPAFRQAAGADGSPDRSNSQVLHSTPRSHRAF